MSLLRTSMLVMIPAPASYAGITVIAFDMRGGDRLSAQSEREINCVPARIYDNAPARSIKGAALHVCQGLGIDETLIDMDAIDAIDRDYWTPRGELYDMSHEKAMPVREMLQGIFTAGMSHLSSGGSLLSVKREGIQPPRGAITPHEMTSELVASFTAPKGSNPPPRWHCHQPVRADHVWIPSGPGPINRNRLRDSHRLEY